MARPVGTVATNGKVPARRRQGRAVPSKRRSAEDRRTQVVAAARKLMAKHGVDGVSMRAIAKAAGVSPAALYLYFPEKIVLMAAVVDAVFEGILANFARAREAAAGSRDPFARVAALMDTYVAWGLAHPEEYRLLFMTPVVGVAGHRPGDPKCRPVSPNGAATFAALAEEVAALMASGHARKGDAAMVAEQIWASGHGLVSLMTTFPEFEWTETQALCAGMRETILRGIAA
ncbi:TetR/AcrR family transcriptional regulator [Elioraea sp.]|uniref:TetR/AcrR family transcriptional regulator n=1 Tax=Elioraea sp. TaxID=2185103 RepID=UPI0025C64603|nr:TetR/AcrR family transcriptional regulator [Elioraea sp.]